VLNDIFRYLAEEPEEDEEPQQETPANGIQEPAPTATATGDADDALANSEEGLAKVDEKLEGAKEEPAVAEVAPAAPVEQVPEEIEAPKTEEVPTAISEEAPKKSEAPAAEPEKPKAPASKPAPSKASSVAMPSGPPKPSVPRTWASLAASAHKVATPVVTPTASQPAPAQTKGTTSSQPTPAAASSQTAAPARDQSPSTSQGEATGWQTATGSKKEQVRGQPQGPAADPDQKRAYIKNVYSQVEDGALKDALTKFGEVEYLDISRAKVSLSHHIIRSLLI
jgi:hypothetical protein